MGNSRKSVSKVQVKSLKWTFLPFVTFFGSNVLLISGVGLKTILKQQDDGNAFISLIFPC